MEKRTPLYMRMRRERHREIAKLQDIIVENMYRVFPRAVIHGGTAIWRCYSGNRFSEDVDAYIDKTGTDRFFGEMKRAGFDIIREGRTENALYSSLSLERTEVRFEALFRSIPGVVREYETCEGILWNVFTLSPEDMVREKVAAYLDRRKVRDLYDIFFMLRYSDKDAVKLALQRLLLGFSPPVDEKELRAIILFGAVPTAADMVEYIRRFV
jgi:predicted nucleotidyltransferase component of viral defense system